MSVKEFGVIKILHEESSKLVTAVGSGLVVLAQIYANSQTLVSNDPDPVTPGRTSANSTEPDGPGGKMPHWSVRCFPGPCGEIS